MRRTGLWTVVCAASLLFANAANAENPRTDCGLLSGYQQGAAWPAYQGCSTRLGQSLASVGPTADPNWDRDLFGNVRSPVVDKDGIVYVGAGAFIHAINPDNGSVLWSTPMWANVASAPAIGADGTIYAVSVAGVLTALDPATGAYKWTYWVTLNASINTSPLIDAQGDIYFVDSANFVHAVHPDGTVKWIEWIPGPILSSLTLSRDDRTLYVGSSVLGMRAVSTDNGAIEWLNLTYAGEFSSPTVGADGTIYVGGNDGRLYALNPFDGSTKWFAENKLFFFLDLWGSITVSPALTPNGDIIFGTEHGMLVSLDQSGNVNWEEDLGWAITGSPVVDSEGIIVVGTASHDVLAIDSTDGSEVWHFHTWNTVASSPAIGPQGQVYIGSNDNHLYSIGLGDGSGIFDETTVAEVASPLGGTVDVYVDENGVETGYDPLDPNNVGGNSNPNGHVAACYDTPTVAQVEAQGGAVLSRPGLDAYYDNAQDAWFINGIVSNYSDSRCAAHLCGEDEVRLTSSDESLLLDDSLSGPGELGDLYQPCAAVEGCGGNTVRFDFAQVDYSVSCATDADCSALADHRCATVCPQDGTSSSPVDDCAGDELVQQCVLTVSDPNCAGLPAPQDEPNPTWCHELRECAIAEDLGDPDAPCIDRNGNAQDCESDAIKNQQEAGVLAAGAKSPPPSTYPPIGFKAMQTGQKCDVIRPEYAQKDDEGGSDSQPGGSNPKWGIDVSAGLNSDFELRPESSSMINPRAHVDAGFNILGYVMGREIKVLGVNGDATVDVCEIGSSAEAVLFNQDIAAFDTGASTDPGDTTEPWGQACNDLREAVLAVQGVAQGRLADVVKVYNRIIRTDDPSELGITPVDADGLIDPNIRTVTKDLCRAISGGDSTLITGPMAVRLANANPQWDVDSVTGVDRLVNAGTTTAVNINPLCDAPLSRETAAALVNVLIDSYTREALDIPSKIGDIFAAGGEFEDFRTALTTPNPDGVAFSASGNEIYDEIQVPTGLGQDFSIIGAKAVFPIGPLQLILEVQGTGDWGIVGGIRYGVKYDLTPGAPGANKELAAAEASASVGPSANVYVDVYVGVGFDFGIAGASVGIGGELKLLGIELPASAGLKLAVVEGGSQPSGRLWPGELANLQSAVGGASLFEPKAFRMDVGGSFGAGAKFSALSGELSLRLRIKFLFFKKTWKKRIAKFDGFSWEKAWVGDFTTKVGEIDGLPTWNPQLDVLPAIPFPDIPRVSASDFPSLPTFSSLVPGVTLPPTPDYGQLRTLILDDASNVPLAPIPWTQPPAASSSMMGVLDSLYSPGGSPTSAGVSNVLPCTTVELI